MRKDKVIDHDHITGKYRGAAHSSCNLKLRIDPDKIKIPVFFHNLRGYDAHLNYAIYWRTRWHLELYPE